MNKEKWSSLPEDIKKVFEDMGREQAEWTGKYVDNHVKEALDWSKAQYKNFQVFELSASDKATISKGVQPIIDDYIKRVTATGIPGNQIITVIYALKTKYEKKESKNGKK
jgi:TRAP-type C4-dicarboxylate transport system substrate-binding protein